MLPQPLIADFGSHNNFQTTFQISFIFGRIDGLDLSILYGGDFNAIVPSDFDG